MISMCTLWSMTLLAGPAGPDPQALWSAAQAGDLAKVRAALDAGVDVNAATEFGVTPLYFAATGGHAEVCRLLIERGAEIDTKDQVEGYRFSPISMAAWKGRTEATLVLMEAGSAEVISALFASAAAGHPEVVEAIIEKRELDPGLLNAVWQTAQSSGHQDVTAVLRKAGVNPPPAPVERPVVKIELETLGTYVGTYEAIDDAAQRFWVVLRDGQLRVGSDPYGLSTLSPTGTHRFDSDGDRLVFEVDADGAVPGYSVQSGEETWQRRRISAQLLGYEALTAPVADVAVAVESPLPWPSFRGAHARGIADGQHPPIRWDLEKGDRRRWQVDTPGLGHSSPVVWGDRVFITTAVGDPAARVTQTGYGWIDAVPEDFEHEWIVLCYDFDTGRELWRRTAHQGHPRNGRHWKATHANCTIAVNGRQVVALFGSEGLYCYDFEGGLKWKRDLGVLGAGWFVDSSFEWGYASSPIIYRDLVIVQCDISGNSFVAAYDMADGTQRWRVERDEIPSWCTPVVYEGPQRVELVVNATKAICGYDPMTGEEFWRLRGNSNITVASPTFAEDLIYITGGYDPIKPIYAVRAGAVGDLTLPDEVDQSEFVAWSHVKGGVYQPTPLAYRGNLYLLASSGVLSCYDAGTGERKYRKRVAGGSGGEYTASPIAADGHIFVTSEDGDVYVIPAADDYRIVSHNRLPSAAYATPAVSNGTILFRTADHLVAFAHRR